MNKLVVLSTGKIDDFIMDNTEDELLLNEYYSILY